MLTADVKPRTSVPNNRFNDHELLKLNIQSKKG